MSRSTSRTTVMLSLGAALIAAALLIARPWARDSEAGAAPQAAGGSSSIEAMELTGDSEGLRDRTSADDIAEAEQALSALTRIDRSAGQDRAQQLLGHAHAGIRQAAVRTLGEVLTRHDVAPLKPAMRDPDPEVRASAARAIGGLRAWDGVDVLLAGLIDPDPFVAKCAYESICKTAGLRLPFDADADLPTRRRQAAFIRDQIPNYRANYDRYMAEQDAKSGA